MHRLIRIRILEGFLIASLILAGCGNPAGSGGDSDDDYLVSLSLTASTGQALTLSPVFDRDTTSYAATLSDYADYIEIEAAVNDPNADISYSAGQTVSLRGETGPSVTIEIEVTAEAGNSRTYTLTVNKPTEDALRNGTWTGAFETYVFHNGALTLTSENEAGVEETFSGTYTIADDTLVFETVEDGTFIVRDLFSNDVFYPDAYSRTSDEEFGYPGTWRSASSGGGYQVLEITPITSTTASTLIITDYDGGGEITARTVHDPCTFSDTRYYIIPDGETAIFSGCILLEEDQYLSLGYSENDENDQGGCAKQ